VAGGALDPRDLSDLHFYPPKAGQEAVADVNYLHLNLVLARLHRRKIDICPASRDNS
jgi:hypothetical protein